MAENPIQELLESPDQDAVRADLAAFFGENAGRYLAKYERLRRSRSRPKMFLSWNWAVFFLIPTWFFHRKMFLHGVVFSILILGAIWLVPQLPAGMCVAAAFALFADYWYVERGLRQVAAADAQGLQGQARAGFFQKAGGVSRMAGSLCLWLVLPLLFFAFLWFTVLRYKG